MAGGIVRQAGIGNWRDRQLAGSEENLETSRGKVLRNSGDNLAGNDWEERNNIGSTQVEVVGLIRRDQGGRQGNGKTRGGP